MKNHEIDRLPLGTEVRLVYETENPPERAFWAHVHRLKGEFYTSTSDGFSRYHTSLVKGRCHGSGDIKIDFSHSTRGKIISYGNRGSDHYVELPCGSILQFSRNWLDPISPLELLAEVSND